MHAIDQAPRYDDLEAYAEQNGCSLAKAAAQKDSPLIKNANVWPKPESLDDYFELRKTPNLVGSKRKDLLTELARAIGKQYQFPASTAFLHGLGVTASALTRNFSFEYWGGESPVTLYCVTSQPPSTGKSGVNDFFMVPIVEAYKEVNKKNRIEQRIIQAKIEKKEKELSKMNPEEPCYRGTLTELDELEEELKNTPVWKPFSRNATPEALENRAAVQCGMVNIASAEAEAITVLLGDVYKDKGGGKGNHGMILSMWDGEHVDSERVTRKGAEGEVRGSIAIIAQDEAIDSILNAGQLGRGIAERFLLLGEPELLGKRDHEEFNPVPQHLKDDYQAMIQNIVDQENKVVLKLSKESLKFVAVWRNSFEAKMARGQEFESNLIRGFMGKADKQIFKIACILHCMENWRPGGKRSTTVDDDYVWWATSLFDELSKTYINAADALGYTGDSSEVTALADRFSLWAEKGRMRTTVNKIVDNVKRSKPFNGIQGLTSKLKRNALPVLEEKGYCVVIDNDVFINPRLK